MSIAIQSVTDLLELANLYPSPHNGQPIRVWQTTPGDFELYFENQRGLQATDISYIFSFVSMGVFVEHLRRAAQALGHGITVTPALPAEADLHGEGSVLFARCTVRWAASRPDVKLLDVLRRRQTSRKNYYAGLAPDVAPNIIKTAAGSGMKLMQLPADQARQAVWLNQRAVFDDMFDEPVRAELNKWLRYNHQQKISRRDGLSYDCMELDGRLLKFIVNHPKLLRAPVLSALIKQYYLQTMKDNSDVFYMMAPFADGTDAYAVGLTVMRVWLQLSEQGYYLHPFGTIMSNHQAHQDFLRLAGETYESRVASYLVFIFRAGKSKPPVRSERIAITDHLIKRPITTAAKEPSHA